MRRLGKLESVDAIQQRERLVAGGATLDRGRQQRPCLSRVAAIECRGSGVQQLFTLALPLRYRTTRTLDVGLCAGVSAIQEQYARPDADRQFVLSAEVMIESGEKQSLDAGVAVALRHLSRFGRVVGTERVGHRKC
jgi:hypothetical protein